MARRKDEDRQESKQPVVMPPKVHHFPDLPPPKPLTLAEEASGSTVAMLSRVLDPSHPEVGKDVPAALAAARKAVLDAATLGQWDVQWHVPESVDTPVEREALAWELSREGVVAVGESIGASTSVLRLSWRHK